MGSFDEWLEAWLNGAILWDDLFSERAATERHLKNLIRQGKKLSAILFYQTEKNCSLQEARMFIEALEKGMKNG
jgi:ribosomal protein L7/L12